MAIELFWKGAEVNPVRGVVRSGRIGPYTYDETKNYYRVRIIDPDECVRIRAQRLPGKGIIFYYCVRPTKGPRGGRTEIQSIAFSKDRFDLRAVRQWLKEYGYRNPPEVDEAGIERIEQTIDECCCYGTLRVNENEAVAEIESIQGDKRVVYEVKAPKGSRWYYALYALWRLNKEADDDEVPLSLAACTAMAKGDKEELKKVVRRYVGDRLYNLIFHDSERMDTRSLKRAVDELIRELTDLDLEDQGE